MRELRIPIVLLPVDLFTTFGQVKWKEFMPRTASFCRRSVFDKAGPVEAIWQVSRTGSSLYRKPGRHAHLHAG